MTLLLVLLSGWNPAPAFTDRCERIELNTYVLDEGQEVLQVIFWEQHAFRGEVVKAYKVEPDMDKIDIGYDHQRGLWYYKFTYELKPGVHHRFIVYADYITRSKCHFKKDPEMANRKVLRQRFRSGMFPQVKAIYGCQIVSR